jgi:hypothetical protein
VGGDTRTGSIPVTSIQKRELPIMVVPFFSEKHTIDENEEYWREDGYVNLSCQRRRYD